MLGLRYQGLFKIISTQIFSLFCISLILSYLFSVIVGSSFMMGGLINGIPVLLFGAIFFKTTGARAAKKVLNAFYLGEFFKLLTTILLFILVFKWGQIQPLPLFLGFIYAHIALLIFYRYSANLLN